MSEEKSVFEVLNSVDVSNKVKDKNGLSYLPWASAWGEVKKHYPDASYRIYPQQFYKKSDDGETTKDERFWHDDGKTGWVEVGVTIDGKEIREVLSIMDYKNRAIPAENITSVDAQKTEKRALCKAIAMHGLGLYVYEGEDLPEEVSKVNELRENITALARKKSSISAEANEKVKALFKSAEKEANPELDDESIIGNINNIDSIEILEKLKKQVLAIRVARKKSSNK